MSASPAPALKTRRLVAAALWAASLVGSPAGAQAAQSPGNFDYYVFTLSWSPGFCDTGGAQKQPQECASGSGAGFVVHGLWPNASDGPNPEDCGSDTWASAAALRLADGVYPSEGLARYEFHKHGVCSGLDAASYFGAVKRLRDAIAIPDALRAPEEAQKLAPGEIKAAFVAANPNLQADDMAITCRGGELIDVRICVAKDLAGFAQCPPKVAGHSCHAASISVAPPR